MKTFFLLPVWIFVALTFNVGIQSHNSIPPSTDASIVPAPVILSPVNNSTCDTVCNFIWTSSGSKLKYELWVSDINTFEVSKRFVTTDTTFSCPMGAVTNQYKYCKVRAWKSSESYSVWSSTITLIHGDAPENIKLDPYYQRGGGCTGRCGDCPHPCGRRPMPH